MTSPTFKKATDNAVDGTNVRYGAPDVKYAFDVLDGTHPNDRLQVGKIEHSVQAFDVVVYQKSGTTIARKTIDGTIVAESPMASNADHLVMQAACDVDFSNLSNFKPKSIFIAPGTYKLARVGGNIASFAVKTHTTIFGYGAILEQTVRNVAPLRVQGGHDNISFFGLTFDCANIGADVQIQGRNNEADPNIHNILFKDCKFINPIIIQEGPELCATLRMGTVQPAAPTTMTGDDTNFRVINCIFDDSIPPPNHENENTYGILEFQNMDGLLVQGCIFLNQRKQRAGAVFNYAHNKNVRIIGNLFYNTHPDAHSDIRISHSTNILIAGNIISQRVRLIDTGYVTLVNNRMQQFYIGDSDAADHDGAVIAYRGSRHVLVANNQFDTNPAPPTMGGVLQTAATRINANANDSTPPRYITITGNQAHVENNFFLVDSTNSSMPMPLDRIFITKNQMVLRNNTTTAEGLIRLVGNTAVPSNAFKDIIIQDNAFMAGSGSAVHNDIDLTTTAMTNIVVRGNVFTNGGVQNIGAYDASIVGNYGTITAQRDSNTGTATITSGNTSIVVTHGVAYTPVLHNILVRPTNALGSATKFWISNATSTQFTINVNTDPGGNATFAWVVARNE